MFSQTIRPILPGSTIGILGGGQLGRMFALAARKMGYRVHSFDSTPDSPAGQISDREYNTSYTDLPALFTFAQNVDVVTYEFENIPVQALDALAQRVVLRPGRDVLYLTQNRQREKEFLQKHHFPCVPFRLVQSAAGLKEAATALGFPCVLKTAEFGYDGKGQQKITETTDFDQVWSQHDPERRSLVGVVESWISFIGELSVVVARGVKRPDGLHEILTFPPTLNDHRNHILASSQAPAPLPETVLRQAESLAATVAERLNVVGLLTIEFFLTAGHQLLVNELAPRPHNSGHYSFDACVTSQFEQQIRAVCGLPLGQTTLLTPAFMRNLLGEVWVNGTPEWDRLLALPGLRLHIYGKSDPRPGRKMGHYTILAPSLAEALEIDERARKILGIKL